MGLPHRYHPDPDMEDPTDAKLYDDCARCDEQAEHLHGLDRQKLAWFWSLMYGMQYQDKSIGRDLTGNELRAVNRMYAMAVIFERLTSVSPSPEALLRFSMSELGE